MDAFIGTIMPWALDFAPQGWFLCQGQELQISQYPKLYALMGTKYGGSGTTFKLPNLCGRVPVGAGELNGKIYTQGQNGGDDEFTLSANQVPLKSHSHTITNEVTATGGGTGTVNMEIKIPINTDNQPSPVPTPPTYYNTPAIDRILGQAKQGSMNVNLYTTNPQTPNASLKPFTASSDISVSPPELSVSTQCEATSSSPTESVSVMQPYQVINYIICVEGYYPIKP